jgi:folate-binding protein YgfZ
VVTTGTPDGPALVLAVDWPGFAGVDLLGPPPDGDPLVWVVPEAVRCDAEAWEAARIEAGVPVNGREITEGTIAAEVGLVERTVSFTKGCFTGQELVARLDARGSKVARSLRAVVIGAPEGASGGEPGADGPGDRNDPDGDDADGDEVPPVGAAVWTADGEHRVGTLSSVARSPGLGATVALATLHRRIVPPEVVSVRWTDGDGSERDRPAEARALPLVG